MDEVLGKWAVFVTEDQQPLPKSWLSAAYPRRDRATARPVRPAPDAAEQAWKLLEPRLNRVEHTLRNERAEPRYANEARPWLSPDVPPDGSPLGAAVVCGLVAEELGFLQGNEAEVFPEAWVAGRGVVFAARAAAELADLDLSLGGGVFLVRYRANRTPGRFDALEFHHAMHFRTVEIMSRVRAHLAAAPESEYQAAVAALAEYRQTPRQRAVTSFLAPTRTDWVTEDCALVAGGQPVDSNNHFLLFHAVSTVEQLDQVVDNFWSGEATQSLAPLATVLTSVGPAAMSRVIRWLDGGDLNAEKRRRAYSALAVTPTDEAFQTLLDRIGEAPAKAALTTAAQRYPARALRLLATAATTTAATSTAATAAITDLLAAHVASHPTVVERVVPDLPEAARQRIGALASTEDGVPDAPAERVPAVLLSPPWEVKRPTRRGRPTVLAELTCSDPTVIAWEPGEQERWRVPQHRVPYQWDRDVPLTGVAQQIREGTARAYDEAPFFILGPDELTRPLLAQWWPRDRYEAWHHLPPLVARYELAALPAVLRVAQDGPEFAAHALLAFAGPEIALLMADWLARLKKQRPAALAWLTRHPAAAARALVPAALGKPGQPRRAAEQALRAIVAAGYDAEVRAAADGYGPPARAAIDTLLAVDPTELLPTKVPRTPDWAEPVLLPRVLLRDRASALPEASVRHLTTMLALGAAGEESAWTGGVRAGMDTIRGACDPASLAEFGWALFERWRSTGMPSKESWALGALGLVGDDDTVRRLAPLIRAWPGEGGNNRALAGLEVLVTIGSDTALLELNRIAEQVTFKALRERAAQLTAEVAAERDLGPEQ
ncbi:hypothetical protein ACQEUX_14675 [Micromonospora sp. CA-259024]|uniref:hypothetical protein n=1 Tax=Micromonospora sp. CA-259024 TaxID=3239965 RepID=UPI003D8E8DF5